MKSTDTTGRYNLEQSAATVSVGVASSEMTGSWRERAAKPAKPRYPGVPVTCDGNYLVGYLTESRITDGGIFYPITSSTQMGELYQQSFAEGKLNIFGHPKLAVETEGEHAAQGGAIAYSVTGKRVVNFTSGQGIAYGIEQYYHAPGKFSTMVLEVGARALTKHALNVHCGHDDVYAALDTGWIMLFAKDAQQAADQAVILRRVTELALTPGINIQDGFLTTHLERSFFRHETELLREFLGAPDDIIDCPTEAQSKLFGPTRRRVPRMIDIKNPILLGPVQNQEHYMNGVVARRNNFTEPILGFLEDAYRQFGELTGRHYGLLSEYRCHDAETVFVSLGCAAENIEAAVDYLRERREARVGSIHVNVLRPFPESAIIKALRGKRNAIVLERTDEPMAGGNPLERDLRTALSKGLENARAHFDLPQLDPEEMPHIFSGVYGLGSRDFRPEGILGAYEFTNEGRARQDGKTAASGESYFALGIDHPYAVQSDNTPSLLPEGAIAVRFHSIGGWGMITTGKNLGAIIGELGRFVAEKRRSYDEFGRVKPIIHTSANPKYGSEKKGAPTAYFLVVAPERIRVNCDLRHVNVVLCCDPKAFTHTNPLAGLTPGGALVMESEESPEHFWERIPGPLREQIVKQKIRLFILPGFDVARNATDRPDLQLRMQGNAFLGAFFRVSPFLGKFGIDYEHFREVVRKQYETKFGRLGDAVIESNMTVMEQGFKRCREVPHGDVDAPDRSSMRGSSLIPLSALQETDSDRKVGGERRVRTFPAPSGQQARAPVFRTSTFDEEFRAGLGYDQPASSLAACGVMAAGTGASASKYLARRETPVFIAENCTQCMDCIAACPDTALPNTAQDIGAVLATAAQHYVNDAGSRQQLIQLIPQIEAHTREAMRSEVKNKSTTPFVKLVKRALAKVDGNVRPEGKDQFLAILKKLPLAYLKTSQIFGGKEKKAPGSGGLFSIFVSDLCKGCAECVTECGQHEALKMVQETEDVNARHTSAMSFFDLLPDTSQKYLGLYDDEHPEESKAAALRNHLMVRRNYEALVSGDGACAGCGEKSILRALATVTESFMRPTFHRKAARLLDKADRLEKKGFQLLQDLQSKQASAYSNLKRAVAHLIFDLGGETEDDTTKRIENHGAISDRQILEALCKVLRQDAFNHQELQALDGRLSNGMSVMAMAAHTGCNTVYGSTPPNNPHPYPWMNSLFQDGATIGWMMGESFMMDHARRSVLPERLTDALLEGQGVSQESLYNYTHFSDFLMTDQEVVEMPKVWVIGGDGGMGDIGFQNVSKVVLQNRPNVKLIMLDTQVYSNTGGQNSDSSPSPGGGDFNQFGQASQGKLVEKKSVSEILTSGHGSPFVAQVSMANAAKLYRSILDALEYRGTAFLQCFTTCQPEHGVGDNMSTVQAIRIRDSRGMPDFVFDPSRGETYPECFDLKGNPAPKQDWWTSYHKPTGSRFNYTVAHWAFTEARFRSHFRKITAEQAAGFLPLDDVLVRVTQSDVLHRRYLNPEHRSFVPDFGVYIKAVDNSDKLRHALISRQMVLFCVERRKAWRVLQSKAAIDNLDYRAQRSLLQKVDDGKISQEDFLARSDQLWQEERAALAKK
ncbi:MAG: 2-oxoacid:acceptor oxidoreductase family protein [Acidobacteriota bacterium]